jgi:uncharacterized protein YutE (UPF0331/DUF86 family)
VNDPRLLEASVKKRLIDAQRHLAALDAAVAGFGDEFDADSFESSWRSDQPAELHRAYVVQAGFENVINTVITAGRELCELKRWFAARTEPSSIEILRLLHENGVVDARVRWQLVRVQELRTKVQHDYANTDASAVREAVVLVLDAAPRLIQDAALALRT